MGYEMLGRLHIWALTLRDDRGQGTVEYVALILLVAGVLAGVVVAGKGMNGAALAKTIVGKLQDSLESVGKVGH